MALIQRCMHDRHLSLAKGVAWQRIVDELGEPPGPGRSRPDPEHDKGLLGPDPADRCSHPQSRKRPAISALHLRRPGAEFGEIRALQRILILRALLAPATDPQIRMARTICSLERPALSRRIWTQPANHLVGAGTAAFEAA